MLFSRCWPQLEALAKEFIKFGGKYSVFERDGEGDSGGSGASDVEGAQAYSIEPPGGTTTSRGPLPDIEAFLSRARSSITAVQLPRRIKWAVLHCSQYESLIEKLRQFNDALVDLMDNNIQTAIHQSTRETQLSVLQLHNKVDDLNQLIKALLPSKQVDALGGVLPESSAKQSASSTAANQDAEDTSLASLAHFKALNATLDSGDHLNHEVALELGFAQLQEQVRGTVLSRSDIMAGRPFRGTERKSKQCYVPLRPRKTQR